jgi:hypothetical protein
MHSDTVPTQITPLCVANAIGYFAPSVLRYPSRLVVPAANPAPVEARTGHMWGYCDMPAEPLLCESSPKCGVFSSCVRCPREEWIKPATTEVSMIRQGVRMAAEQISPA